MLPNTTSMNTARQHPKFASYVRVSSKNQLKDATIQLQIKRNKHAASVLGCPDGELLEFKDEGISAYNRVASSRPAIQALLQAVADGLVDVIIFYDESRLSRQIEDFYLEVYVEIMKLNPNVKFYRSSDITVWDPNEPETKRNLIQAFRESSNKSRLATHSQESRFDEGQRPGARLPFGIRQLPLTTD